MARTLSPTVGFVGVGNMGGAIAARLLESGPIIVWDGDADRAAAFADKGATVAPSGPDLAANCEIILTCLPESRHVESVLFDEDGLSLYLNRDVLIADMTTGDPTVSRQIASRLLEQHVHFVDAPVSGGPSGVAAGTLAIMIGGEDDAKIMLGAKPGVLLHAVWRDADHGDAQFREGVPGLGEGDGLLGATGRVVLGVKIDNDRRACECRERHVFATIARQGEVRCQITSAGPVEGCCVIFRVGHGVFAPPHCVKSVVSIGLSAQGYACGRARPSR